MPAFFLPAVPEFEPVWVHCSGLAGIKVSPPRRGFVLIECENDLVLDRKETGLKPAVWFGLFTGGLEGRILQFDIDRVHVAAMAEAP